MWTGSTGWPAWPPHSDLAVAGSVVVYMSVAPTNVLTVVAVNPATGDVLWTAPADPSDRETWRWPTIAADEHGVYTIGSSPMDVTKAVLNAWDPATGAALWSTEIGAATDGTPRICDHAVCVNASADGNIQELRFDTRTGAQTSAGAWYPEPLLASNKHGLSIVGSWDETVLTQTSGYGTTVDWQVAYADVFGPNNGYPPSHEWTWSAQRIRGGWLLYLGSDRPHHRQSGVTALLDDHGTLIWRRDNTYPCWVLGTAAWSVLCSAHTYDPATDSAVVRLDSIDQHTGETVWSFDLAIAVATGTKANVVRYTENGYTLHSDSGRLKFSLHTGPVLVPGAEPAGWCLRDRDDEYIDANLDDTQHEYNSAEFYAPCTGLGDPVATPPEDVPAWVGPTVDGWSLWVQDDQLHGISLE